MLPSVVLEFSRLADNPNSGPGKLGGIIESDVSLTCELLRYANSSLHAGRARISTAQQAISRLGIRSAKSFLLSTAVQQAMKASQSKLIHIPTMWLSNLERALLAREFARLLKVDADLAYSASLLHDFLLPAFANELTDVYLQHLQHPNHDLLTDHERVRLGWDHAQATAHVLRTWQFPDELVVCTRLHHGGLAVVADRELGRTAAAAVALAALAPDPLRQSGDGLVKLQQFEAVHPDFDLMATAQRVAEQLGELTPLGREHPTLERRLEKFMAVAS
jgi:HD-like signal output (HDOD) protein